MVVVIVKVLVMTIVVLGIDFLCGYAEGKSDPKNECGNSSCPGTFGLATFLVFMIPAIAVIACLGWIIPLITNLGSKASWAMLWYPVMCALGLLLCAMGVGIGRARGLRSSKL